MKLKITVEYQHQELTILYKAFLNLIKETANLYAANQQHADSFISNFQTFITLANNIAQALNLDRTLFNTISNSFPDTLFSNYSQALLNNIQAK